MSKFTAVPGLTWVGTNMFFNRPGDEVVADALTRTREYELIGTSRIKLVGHLAKVAEIPKGRKRDRSSYEDEGETNQQIRQQADFLERLMAIKKGRGETDNVPVSFSVKPVINSTRTKQPSDEMALEIADLNRQILKGDEEARKRLLEINSQLEDERLQPQPVSRFGQRHWPSNTQRSSHMTRKPQRPRLIFHEA